MNASIQVSTRIGAAVRGRVQGVGFRYFVREAASRFGLCGWVRNTADGGVDLEAQGPADRIESFVEELRRGPPLSRVSDLQIIEVPAVEGEQGFEIRL